MSNGIYVIGKGIVKAGKIDAARAALAGVIDAVQKDEPGVSFYEHTIHPGTGAWVGLERYDDSAALKAHLLHPVVGQGLGAFMGMCDVESVTIVGQVSEEVRAMMKPFNPTEQGASLGFARLRP